MDKKEKEKKQNRDRKRREYLRSKEKIKARVRKWQLENKDYVAAKNKKRSRSIKGRFSELTRRAKRYDISCTIPFIKYEEIIEHKSCHYCAEALPEAGSGLDRKDNTIGYTIENVVPCCTRCNKMKNSYLTYNEMVVIWELRLRKA